MARPIYNDAALDDFTEIEIVFEPLLLEGGRSTRAIVASFGTQKPIHFRKRARKPNRWCRMFKMHRCRYVNDELDVGVCYLVQMYEMLETSPNLDMESSRTMMEDLRDEDSYFDPDFSMPERSMDSLYPKVRLD